MATKYRARRASIDDQHPTRRANDEAQGVEPARRQLPDQDRIPLVDELQFESFKVALVPARDLFGRVSPALF